ncbi:MAG: serpin family protein [Thermoplasmata archaeon]|nr:MAG: serpin family protein [Thermoplasmata archaeon]
MRKVLLSMFMILLLITVAVIAGCLKDEDNGDKSKSPTYSVINEGMNAYVNSSNEFTFEMYKQLIDSNKNVFFSPYSISTALGMVYEGARGQTSAEMGEVLDLPEDDETRREMIQAVQSLLNKEGTSYELSVANAYWLREGANLKEEYRDAIESYYLAFGQHLDFASDPAGSVETINNWVEDKTNGKIKDLLSPNDVDALTYLVLTNAIYFKSDWKYQFDSNATEERMFYKTGGEGIMTDMMHMCDEEKRLNYAANSDVQLLQLPYKDEELSMYVMLPRENDIASMEPILDHEYLSNLKDDISAEYVDLYLPKFKFEQKYMLKEKLSAMGMPTAFGGGADFSGITSEADLFISKVIHQSFVEVNEEGTEAAAATAVVMKEFGGGGSSSPEPIVFRADHPFLFFIEHKETGQILFMGKVENPSV